MRYNHILGFSIVVIGVIIVLVGPFDGVFYEHGGGSEGDSEGEAAPSTPKAFTGG